MVTRTTRSASVAIGEAARRLGISEDTLRYYEREGLIEPLPRDASGRRSYSETDLASVSVIVCMRKAGLGIGDLKRFVELFRRGDESSDRVSFLRERREALVERRDALTLAIGVLEEKIRYFAETP